MAYASRGRSGRPSRPSSGGRSFGGNRRHSGGGRHKGPKKENIHPSKFIKAAKLQVEEEVYVAKHTFADFPIVPTLQRNLQARNFETPSPIQDQSIPVGLEGKDVIGIANTGTGKTVAFAVPVLNKLLLDRNSRVIIMAPTRELASQILDEFKTLTRGSKLYWALLIGGSPMRFQLNDLRRSPRIIIGTPGRIKDHIERGSLSLARFDTVVLDEVDRMLDMGFVNDMRTILGKMPDERQSFFYSATMAGDVSTLINEFGNNPVTVSVKTGDTSDRVEQDIVTYNTPEERKEKLHDILIADKAHKFIIFDETKRGVDRLSRDLRQAGVHNEAIHGDKSQGQRQRALDNFKRGKARVMIATDVAARGIDVKGITHVINYATPQSYSDYVHRIGRAGRAGETGTALTFVEERAARAPERSYGGGGGRGGARRSSGSRSNVNHGNRRDHNRGGQRQQSGNRSRKYSPQSIHQRQPSDQWSNH